MIDRNHQPAPKTEPYERPIIVKETKMTFPRRILNQGKEVVCKQCSSCHGCR